MSDAREDGRVGRFGEGSGELVLTLDVSAVPREPAGAGRYIVELARSLDGMEAISLRLVTRRDDAERWGQIAPGATTLPVVPDARPMRLAYERTWLAHSIGESGLARPWRPWRPRGLARRAGPAADAGAERRAPVYHGPHYTLPPGIRGARVVTIHDVTFFDHPEWHERSKVTFFRRAIRRSTGLADVVVCVSHTTARRLAEVVDVPAEIVVAEHGVDHRRFAPGEPDARALPPAAAGGELVVHVGTLEPRKGLVELVRAFDDIARDRPVARLVLAGIPGWGAAEVDRAITRAVHRERIVRLGWVGDASVVALMRAARVVAYPSTEEGFGLPALEAMAVGAPLVTTAGTAMAEFASGAAWLSPPGDARALAHALSAALDASPAERERRRKLGLERAASFTWERTAEQHLAAYRRAVELARARPGGHRPGAEVELAGSRPGGAGSEEGHRTPRGIAGRVRR